MNYFQTIAAPDGTELVVVARADYDALLRAAGQDASDVRAADAALADPARYPAAVVNAILDGSTPVAAWRRYRGLSQQELANRAGISQAGVARFETRLSGKIPQGRPETRKAIARSLDVPVGALDPLDED